MSDIVKVLVFSLSSVAFLFVISKLSGKKQIAQLEFIDYVMGISIGSIAAEMATDLNENPFYHYLIAMAIFFLFDIAVTLFGRKGPVAKHFLKGRPLMIIYEGKIDYTNLRKSKLAVNELIGMCREKNFFDIRDIEYAIFENSGKLSILPKGPQKPLVISDLGVQPTPPVLTNYLIIDGKISYSGLSEINKDEKWLFKKIGVANEKEIKGIILGIYDDQNNSVTVYHKQDCGQARK